MKKFWKNIVKLKKISTIKDFRFGTFPSFFGSGSGPGYTFYRPPGMGVYFSTNYRHLPPVVRRTDHISFTLLVFVCAYCVLFCFIFQPVYTMWVILSRVY